MATLNSETFRRIMRHPFFHVFIFALAIRLIYLSAMVGQIGLDPVLTFSPDVSQYVQAAEAISNSFDFATPGVLIYGPGWPLFLGIAVFFVGLQSLSLLLIQILISSLGAWLLTLFAYRLTGNRPVAIVAGLINALSMTSITLGNILLSDTLFFALTLSGFIFFIQSLDTGRPLFSVLSALTLSWAALTRGIGLFFFILLIIMAWGYRPHSNSGSYVLRPGIKKVATITVLIIVVVMSAWGVRNYMIYDLPQIGFSGPYGMSRVVCLAKVDLDGTDFDICMNDIAQRSDSQATDNSGFYGPYSREAQAAFFTLTAEHPLEFAWIFLKNVNRNIHCESETQYSQLPQWRHIFERYVRQIYKKGLNYRVSLLSLIGLFLLYRRRRYHEAVILAAILIYFALFSGLTLWQGSRIFYPGQIAWAILSSYSLIYLWSLFSPSRKP